MAEEINFTELSEEETTEEKLNVSGVVDKLEFVDEDDATLTFDAGKRLQIELRDANGNPYYYYLNKNGVKKLHDYLGKYCEKINAIPRFFLDKRAGCAAVRDRQHIKHDPTYPGLHKDTVDVVEYRHGYTANNQWNMNETDIEDLNSLCEDLNEKHNLLKLWKPIDGLDLTK